MPLQNNSPSPVPYNRDPQGLGCSISFKKPSPSEMAISSVIGLMTAGQSLKSRNDNAGSLFKVSAHSQPKKLADGIAKRAGFVPDGEIRAADLKNSESLIFIPHSVLELYQDLHSRDASQIVDLNRLKPSRIRDLFERLPESERSSAVGKGLQALLKASKKLSSLQKLYCEGTDIVLYHIDETDVHMIVPGKVREVAGHTFEAAFYSDQVSSEDTPGITLKPSKEIWLPKRER
jgi:hypothetical protein